MGTADLSGGVHRIRVSYFQGPRFQVALVLQIAPPGQDFRVFSTDEFKPPLDLDTWRFPADWRTDTSWTSAGVPFFLRAAGFRSPGIPW